MEETRWERYRDPIAKAKRKYLDKKKQVTVILDPEEHEVIKAYCESRGISMQGFFKELALAAIGTEASLKNSAK